MQLLREKVSKFLILRFCCIFVKIVTIPFLKSLRGKSFQKMRGIMWSDWKYHIQIQKIRTKDKSRVKRADKQRPREKTPKITAMLKAEARATTMWN